MILRHLLLIAVFGSQIWAAPDAQAQAEAKSPSPTEYFRLQQHGGGLGVQIDESVVVLALGDATKGQQWVVERQRRERNWCGQKSDEGKCIESDVTVHDWAASSTCRELTIYIDGFSDFRETGGDHRSVVVFDAPLITLDFAASASRGDQAPGIQAHSVSEYIGPLATWWHDAEDGLKTCWTTTPPVIDGHSLVARLTTANP